MRFSLALLFVAFAAVAARDTETQLKAIKDHHEARMAKLAEMIEERRQMTEDHESGRRRLSDEEYDRASRQLVNFQRKLDSLKQRTDEDHMERFEELKSLHKMNRLEFMDVEGMKRKLQTF
mmetsp:Transcript_31381/g.90454  ORF Transcript_31381/g.90454 Transcript_31381/m.90454 type:complete len:121 (+) Transcript_31381:89-451(+)|eukprot:CAMPEP_0176087426 /NCGR_PEP_ID=MMETSP0120_2-20121206/43768_1 /TAXON_ID=160619 /ORGANISM="Kryptoperidinium foliaceum, Strain CCMP 1326" /LENGTH=120 /DNA_ID=CAMNT_0017421269 /DNA_START=101 /DNA_END=463 /DNA_ORIENTATION=-